MTLIDLLVVIAIIGSLLALLLPAVAAQRETARKAQCASRLRQVGIGLQAYHEAHSTFPSGHVAEFESGPDGMSWGWGALLLPFIEQQALSDRLDPTRRSFDDVATDPDTAPFLRTNVDVYRCPSDTGGERSHLFRSIFVPVGLADQLSWSKYPADPFAGSGPLLAHISMPPAPPPSSDEPQWRVAVKIARSNYVACIGSRWKPRWEDWRDADFGGDGLFGRNSEVRHAEISDGASNTLAVGERSDRNYAAVWAGGNSWQGCGFVDNQMVLGTAFYPINDAPIPRNLDCDGQGSANFSSYHPGGANFVYADGSVHFLAQEIDDEAFQALARRGDGEDGDDGADGEEFRAL